MTEQRDAERKPVPQPQSIEPEDSTSEILSDDDLEGIAGGSDSPPPSWKP